MRSLIDILIDYSLLALGVVFLLASVALVVIGVALVGAIGDAIGGAAGSLLAVVG